jgi:S-DNA-T family DNA segregation ATPase FtsK/SpoIIIE
MTQRENMTGRLPVPDSVRDVIPADPVYDGELVDDAPAMTRRTARRRFMNWWLRSRHVPTAFKSRQAAKQAAKDTVVWLLRSPFRFVGSVGRGLIVSLRAWRQWVRVHDYREAAEQAEKLADKFVEIRALTLFRWKVTGIVAVAGMAVVTVVGVVYGGPGLWIAAGVGSVALAITGRRKDGAPGRKAVLAGPRTLTWTMDPQVLVDARSGTRSWSARTSRYAWSSALRGSATGGRSRSICRPPARQPT